jgi:hypothetical protein
MVSSVVFGIVAAVIYHLSSTRSQSWLSKRVGRGLALLSVSAFLARLVFVGVVFYAVRMWTPMDLVVVAVAFVVTFTLLGGYALYRFAVGGRPAAPSPHLLP